MITSKWYSLHQKLEQCCIKSMSTHVAVKPVFREDGKPDNWDQAKPFSEIPCPPSLPFVGNAYDFIFGKFRNLSIYQATMKMQNEFGNICKFTLPIGDLVLAFNPDDIEMVYRTEGIWPRKRTLETFVHYRKNIRQDVYKGVGGVLTEEGGKAWGDFRSKVNPAMMQPRMIKQYIIPVEEVADEFIVRMAKLRDANNEMPKNFRDELKKWSLESIARIAMDTRLGCLEDDLPADSDPQKMIRSMNDFHELSFKLDILPHPWKFIKTPGYKRIMNVYDTMTNTSLKYIDAATKRIQENPHKSVDEESVLEKLLKIDRQVAVVMVMDMLFAGVDTTSVFTSILLYYIATHQPIQDKLREEARTILPNKDSRLPPDFLNSIPYLKACIKESARILPLTIGSVRTTAREIVLSGYQIPKGIDVFVAHPYLHLSESQFPKPHEFIPERWLSTRRGKEMEDAVSKCPVRSAKDAHPFAYMPFGFGPRMCIGKRFAELEMETFMLKLLRNYKIEWNYGEMKYLTTIINVPAIPLKYKMTEVD